MAVQSSVVEKFLRHSLTLADEIDGHKRRWRYQPLQHMISRHAISRAKLQYTPWLAQCHQHFQQMRHIWGDYRHMVGFCPLQQRSQHLRSPCLVKKIGVVVDHTKRLLFKLLCVVHRQGLS